MSGDWGASKLLWLVLAYAFASGHVAAASRAAGRRRFDRARWVVTLPEGVGS